MTNVAWAIDTYTHRMISRFLFASLWVVLETRDRSTYAHAPVWGCQRGDLSTRSWFLVFRDAPPSFTRQRGTTRCGYLANVSQIKELHKLLSLHICLLGLMESTTYRV